ALVSARLRRVRGALRRRVHGEHQLGTRLTASGSSGAGRTCIGIRGMEGHSMTWHESDAGEQNTTTRQALPPDAQRRPGMRYKLKQIYCRPWTLSYLSVKLIESHYENNYGGALRRLNAITEELESLDFEKTPAHVLNGLKREQLLALNSTLLHELYFASMGGDGQPTKAMTDILGRDFGSLDRWRAEFRAMGYALGGGSGWVLLTYVPGDGRLINQYAADHTQAVASGVPILALDMYEHAYHLDLGANARAYVDTFLPNVDWPALDRR